ncbi:MAG: hypothetical protein SF187_25400 [Deltaproteobacteria bacterium]|nr:hypothetical protein [Deltaproteobacteria bacterium]
MRLIGFFFAGLLVATLGVQTIILRKANMRLETLEKQLTAMRDEQHASEMHGAPVEREATLLPSHRPALLDATDLPAASLGALGAAAQQAGGLAGIAAAGDDPLPLPLELSSPQAREQLAAFVRVQFAKERQAEERQRVQEMIERQNQFNDALAQKLGLAGNTSAQFLSVLGQAQEQRRDLMAKGVQNNMPRAELRDKMREVSQKADDQIKALLGEEKFKQYEDHRRQEGPRGGFGRGANQ